MGEDPSHIVCTCLDSNPQPCFLIVELRDRLEPRWQDGQPSLQPRDAGQHRREHLQPTALSPFRYKAACNDSFLSWSTFIFEHLVNNFHLLEDLKEYLIDRWWYLSSFSFIVIRWLTLNGKGFVQASTAT